MRVLMYAEVHLRGELVDTVTISEVNAATFLSETKRVFGEEAVVTIRYTEG